jgi:hypothetical protein
MKIPSDDGAWKLTPSQSSLKIRRVAWWRQDPLGNSYIGFNGERPEEDLQV